MDLDLVLLTVATGQSQVEELPAVSQIPHGRAQVGVQLVPAQTELFTFHVGGEHDRKRGGEGDVLIFLFSQNYNMAAGSKDETGLTDCEVIICSPDPQSAAQNWFMQTELL